MRPRLCLCAIVTFWLIGPLGCARDSSPPPLSSAPPSTPTTTAAAVPTTRGAAADDEDAGYAGNARMDDFLDKRRAGEQRVRDKIRIPDTLANTPEAEHFARAAMRVYEKHEPDEVATLRIIGADVFDMRLRQNIVQSMASLKLMKSSPPPVMRKATGEETGEYYFAIAPAPDLDPLARTLVKAGTGTHPQIDAEQRVIVLTAPPPDAPNGPAAPLVSSLVLSRSG